MAVNLTSEFGFSLTTIKKYISLSKFLFSLKICREGYLRLSGYEYSMTHDNLDDDAIHLTNNAI